MELNKKIREAKKKTKKNLTTIKKLLQKMEKTLDEDKAIGYLKITETIIGYLKRRGLK